MLENRIMQVFAYSTLSRLEFASRLGISNAVLSHISSGRNKAGMDLVLGVLTHFPEIDPEWLLLGKGEMLKKENSSRLQLWKDELFNQIEKMKIAQQDLSVKLQELESKVKELE